MYLLRNIKPHNCEEKPLFFAAFVLQSHFKLLSLSPNSIIYEYKIYLARQRVATIHLE